MSPVHRLLDDLAVIGATIRPAGEQLILRAGPIPIPAALVRRIRDAKGDLLALLANHAGSSGSPRPQMDIASGKRVVEWLNQHPFPSPAGRCAWCGKPDAASAVVVPFGTEPETHTWLHAECWPAWHQERRNEALRELNAARDVT